MVDIRCAMTEKLMTPELYSGMIRNVPQIHLFGALHMTKLAGTPRDGMPWDNLLRIYALLWINLITLQRR